MKMIKTMIAAVVLAAAFAFTAVADVWYEGNNVTVSGTGTASVTYRSESATTAWLDITVADGATASLTSLVNTSDPAVTISIQKLGGGLLNIASPLAVSYTVEEGTLQVPNDCWGGHSEDASAYTLTVHENGTVKALGHVPLPNVVMCGGRFDGYIDTVFDGEQKLRFYKGWALKHNIKVLPSSNGPSVISSYACHIGHREAAFMPTFDIDEGAELQIDAMICNGAWGGETLVDSYFTKIGAGTLTFLRGGSITGKSTLKEGTLKFAAGASLGPDAKLNTYAGTTIELEDGAAFDTPINSSLSCTAAEYAVLTNCAIWVDAWQETATEGASVPTIANRGTVAGSFAPPSSGNACTFTANGVNGRPSYRFNGSNQSMLFSNLAYGTSSDPQNNVMLFIAFERNSYAQYRGFFSFALSSIALSDYQSDYTMYHQDNGETSFGLYNKSLANNIGTTKATNGTPCVLSFFSNSSKRRTEIDYIDGTNNQNNNSGAFSVAFNRMVLGSRFAANCVPNNPWDGAIGEVIVCTNYDEATYNTILAYMKRKWHSGTRGEKCGVVAIKVPQGTAAATTVGGLSDGQTPTLTKTGAGELMVNSVAADSDVVVSEGALSLIPTSVVSKIDVWMDAADEDTLTVADGEVVSVRNKGRAGGNFVKNLRAGVSDTVSPNLPLLTSMNGHTALGFDGTRALVLDSYTNHNDDTTYTVFVAARVGDGIDPTVSGSGRERSPFSLATAASAAFDYDAPVGCHIEPRDSGIVAVYGGVYGRAFSISGLANFKAGAGFVFAHYNYNYGALAYLQTFTNGAPAEAGMSHANHERPHPSAIDVVQVGGRLGPKGTSFYYGSASTANMWKGEVGELIVCTRQPTEAERAAILAYLRAKWFLPGGAATTPAAIETVLAPSLDRNVKVTAAGGTELKSFAATQPLSGLAVTGNATITRGGIATAAGYTMFDIGGNLLLPASMTLRIATEPEENIKADLIRYSGSLDGSGTTWSIDAKRPSRWSIETAPGAIRVFYSIPGTMVIFR